MNRAVVIGIAVLVAISAGMAWLLDRERAAEERGRLSQRIREDSILIQTLSIRRTVLDTQLVQVLDTVQRVVERTRTVVERMPPETRRETVYVAQIDTLERTCLLCAEAARAYRDTAEAQIAGFERMVADLKAQTRVAPKRRFHLGATVGYGCVQSESIRCGPGATVGVAITP